jgi:bifunctional non-homologous end joining protein LigD
VTPALFSPSGRSLLSTKVTRLYGVRPHLRPMSASRELQHQLKRIEPCLPRPAPRPPVGPGWIHEIKHDGYRIMAERNRGSVRLYTRKDYDFAERFPLAAALRKLPARSCVIDGEAIVCDANGLRFSICCGAGAVKTWSSVLDGQDLRRAPIEERKAILAKLLRPSIDGIAFNEHYSGDGAIIYKHACALGCEGIVSKRLGSSIGPVAPSVG